MIKPLVNSLIDDAVSARAPYLMVSGGAGTGKSLVVVRRIQRLLAEGVLPAEILIVVPGLDAANALRERLATQLATTLEPAQKPVQEPVEITVRDSGDSSSSSSGGSSSSSSGGGGDDVRDNHSSGNTFDNVRIVTIHDLCVDILSAPNALAATGRYPRIINNIENIFLLEDLKVLGIKPRRLKEMLKFFYREWTELGDGREDFFVAKEEELVHSTVKKALIDRKAMLEPELSNITVRFLQNHNEALAQLQVPHVLVDDYLCLNKASQQVCCLLAAMSLTVTGNPCQTDGILEPYPWTFGLADFAAQFKDAEKFELSLTVRCPQTVAACGNALQNAIETGSALVTFDEGTAQGMVTCVKWTTPNDEFDGIASYLEQRIGQNVGKGTVPLSTFNVDKGTVPLSTFQSPNQKAEDSGKSGQRNRPLVPLNARDVLVVVPNRAWGRALARQLEVRGIATSSILANYPLGGNPREKKTSVGMRAYTLLNLIAQPTDVVAWRSWCGFDDYLANSAQWATLGGWADEQGLGLLEALEALGALGAAAPFQVLLDAYREGQRLIEACAGKRGYALVSALGQLGFAVPPELEQLLEPVQEDDTAVALYERAARRALEPTFAQKDAIRIGIAQSTQGLEAKLVVIAGLVNGFTPSGACLSSEIALDAKARQLDRERLQFYAAVTRSSGELVLSYFHKETLLQAEPLGMAIGRIRVEHGERMAVLSPSDFLAEMGDALPPVVGELL